MITVEFISADLLTPIWPQSHRATEKILSLCRNLATIFGQMTNDK